MAVERPPGAIGLILRIDVQHYSCDIAPVSTNRIRVEQAQIRDDVFLVVNGQYGIGRRDIGDIGIKRRLLHWLFSQQVVDRSILLLASGILMIAKQRSPLRPNERTSPVRAVRSEKCQGTKSLRDSPLRG